jgi:hypothetical protein
MYSNNSNDDDSRLDFPFYLLLLLLGLLVDSNGLILVTRRHQRPATICLDLDRHLPVGVSRVPVSPVGFDGQSEEFGERKSIGKWCAGSLVKLQDQVAESSKISFRLMNPLMFARLLFNMDIEKLALSIGWAT